MVHARRVVLVTLAILACARTAAPTVIATESADSARATGTCEGDHLEACVAACFDSTCLDWCASSSCRVAVGELWSCMTEIKRGFLEARPMPGFRFKGPVDEPTLEAAVAKMQADSRGWHPAYVAALDDGWANVCRPKCVELIPSGFCERDKPDYRRWVYAADVPTTVRPVPMALASDASDVSLALMGGRVGEMKWDALSRLVADQARGLRDAQGCLAKLESVELVLGVDVDPNGTPGRISLVEGEPETGACIAAILEREFILPSRVVAEFPRVEVGVQIRSKDRAE